MAQPADAGLSRGHAFVSGIACVAARRVTRYFDAPRSLRSVSAPAILAGWRGGSKFTHHAGRSQWGVE